MTNSHNSIHFFCFRQYPPAFFFRGCNGFLQQNIVAPFQRLQTGCTMQVVGCGNNYRICEFFFFKNVFPCCKTICRFNLMCPGHRFQAIRVRVGHRHDFHFAGSASDDRQLVGLPAGRHSRRQRLQRSSSDPQLACFDRILRRLRALDQKNPGTGDGKKVQTGHRSSNLPRANLIFA